MPQQAPAALPAMAWSSWLSWFAALGAVVAQTFSPAPSVRGVSSPASLSPCAFLSPVLASLDV